MEQYRPRSLADLENAAFRARYKVGSYPRLHNSPGQKPKKKGDSFPFGAGVAAFLATGATIGLGAPDTHASAPPIMKIIEQFRSNLAADSYSLEDVGFPETEQPLDTSEIIGAQEEPAVTQVPEITQIAPPKTQSVAESTSSDYLSSVFNVIENYPGKFTERDLEDFRRYRRIYEATAVKYDIDPIILWISHQEETTSSRDPLTNLVRTVRDYDENGNVLLENVVYGAMQLDQRWYGPAYVEDAFKGLEYLNDLPVHKVGDAKQIAGAARKISEDLKASGGDLLEAFKKYAAPGVAIRRWKEYNWRSQILPNFQP